ncbi:Protein BATH-38 [Aphelenchoides avenae]|nr:Protein BATH-38 [Aphelenchus avenae]
MSEKANLSQMGTITLKINDISAYMRRIGRQTQSRSLQVAGVGWYIHAYPSVVDKITYLSCFLAGENASKWTAWVDATFRIVKKKKKHRQGGGFGNKLSFHADLFGKSPLAESLGYREFVTSKMLLSAASGYVVDGSVEIRVDFSVTDVCGASLNVFDIPGALAADVKLKVGDSVFYANKGYLSVVSSVFRDMFALTEAAEDKEEMDEFELEDLNAGEFKEFLGVIYPTRYPITDANVVSVLRLAVRYDVEHAIAECERHLLGSHKLTWFDKLKLAVDLRRHDLRNQLIATMTCDDVKAFQLAEDRDELGMDVVIAVVERQKLLSAAIGFVGADISEADISMTDACSAPFNAYETAESLAADVKLKYLSVVSSVFRDLFAFTEAAEDEKGMDEIKLNDLDASEFQEFLGVIYPTYYPITDYNVTRTFRIADRYDVKRLITDCESHLYGANNRHFILKMTWDDFETIDRNDNKDQLRMNVLQALIDEHICVCRP